ncbi:MAG: tetratricopeptide repeat protein [Vampirovibrio sp.]|nr:tetratricopeptide repeat protein [Vampirovibrio sp.]
MIFTRIFRTIILDDPTLKTSGIFLSLSALLCTLVILSTCWVSAIAQTPSVNAALEHAEVTLLGQKFSNEPVETRLSRLEATFGQPGIPGATMEMRLSRVYAALQSAVSQESQQQSIKVYNQGVDAFNAGNPEEAIKLYNHAIQLNPAMMPAYNNLGTLFESRQQYDDAIEVYRAALDVSPNDPVIHRNLAVVYEKSGNIPAALTEYKQYLDLTPTPDPAVETLVAKLNDAEATHRTRRHYISEVYEATKGRRVTWPEKSNPIPIYIKIVDQDQAKYIPVVYDALRTWEDATGGRIRFKEVNRLDGWGIHLTLKQGPLSDPFKDVGHAKYNIVQSSRSEVPLQMQVQIKVNTGTPQDNTLPLKSRIGQIRRLTLHELGHGIGLWGHSPHPQDIMYPRPIINELSDRDVHTIRKLYNLPTG